MVFFQFFCFSGESCIFAGFFCVPPPLILCTFNLLLWVAFCRSQCYPPPLHHREILAQFPEQNGSAGALLMKRSRSMALGTSPHDTLQGLPALYSLRLPMALKQWFQAPHTPSAQAGSVLWLWPHHPLSSLDPLPSGFPITWPPSLSCGFHFSRDSALATDHPFSHLFLVLCFTSKWE